MLPKMADRHSHRNAKVYGFCGIPFRLGELGDVLSGDALLSGDRLFVRSLDHCGVGEEQGLFFRPFVPLVGLPCTRPNVKVAFIGPVGLVDGDAILRTLWAPCPDIFTSLALQQPACQQ